MEKLIPYFDMDKIYEQAAGICTDTAKYEDGTFSEEMMENINRIITQELWKLPVLPNLYFEGMVTEDTTLTNKEYMQAQIVGIRNGSDAFFMLGDNPFENKSSSGVDWDNQSKEDKWIPEVQHIIDKERFGTNENWAFAGAEYDYPVMIGYLPEDVPDNAIAKRALDKLEED